ncbi:MAG: DNA translocase FtsK 4TM domain-containing protein [Planctomycetota bacterium]
MGRKKSSRKSKRANEAEASLLGRLGGVLGAFIFGGELDEDTSTHLREISGIVLLGLSVWLLLSMVSYAPPGAGGGHWGGQAGLYLAEAVFIAIGWSGFLLIFLGLAWGTVLVARKEVAFPTLRVVGGISFLLSSAFLFELAAGSGSLGHELPYGPGGWLAEQLLTPDPITGAPGVLIAKFGGPGCWILLGIGALISFMLATEMAFYPSLVALREWMEERRDEEDEGGLRAILGWLGRTASGLWDFLRGKDLERATEPVTLVVPHKTRRSKPKALPPAKKKKGAIDTSDLFEEQDEEDEDDEEEWEYVDEDGNVVDPEDLAEEEEEEEEYEEDDEEEEEDLYDEDEEEEEEEEEPEPEPEPVQPAAKAKPKPKPVTDPAEVRMFEPPTPPAGPWRFPSLDLLEPPGHAASEDAATIEEEARKLENVLSSFRVEATVVGAKVGAAVTMFELEVPVGTRLNKVTQLSQEIAAALRAKSVRIIAPIPGKSTIGIEVPNRTRRIVRLSELIRQEAYDKKFMALPLFLGMDAEGTPVVADLARMPHLLIAGTTGSGKSVCINTILASLLLTRSPHDVQMILVDPKMVELQMFSKVPHLMLPVVTDMRQATNVLLWACEKMEGRYDLFKNAGVRNIAGYNKLSEDQLKERMGEEFHEERTPRHVPYIVIVIDEMADLMMTSKKEAELAITRLAQKSRAVGIHVIVATQRPSTDVITGVLKGNLPTRIAFQVASKIDSRVILDAMGAEKLLGQGDMLYTPPQSSQLKRVQGALVEDHEIQGVVDFVCQESAPNFSQELVQSASGSATKGQPSGADQDELWDEAVRVILKSKRGSASLLQRALGIGYTRASRLIDLMTAEGIVGEHKGSKAREVLMSLEDWEEMHGSPLPSGDQGASDD